MVVTERRKLKPYESWRINNNPLDIVKDYKYLGVWFNWKNNWSKHITEAKAKAAAANSQILKFLNSRPNVNLQLQMNLFDSMVASKMLYGTEILAFDNGTSKLDSVSNKFYKNILGVQAGTAGCALEILLNRVKPSFKAKLRALTMWRKLEEGSSQTTSNFALKFQKGRVQYGKGWANHIKLL